MLTKQYIARNDIFAELCNYYIFNGQRVIKPEDLQEADVTEQLALPVSSGKRKAEEKLRDVLKECVLKLTEKMGFLFVGVENQTKIHYAMPVRNLLYDVLNYSEQVTSFARKHKEDGDVRTSSEFLSGMRAEDKLIPVVTLVVNFDSEKWNAPCSLHEMLRETSPELLAYVNDYKIHLIDPHQMAEADFNRMQGSLPRVLRFIGASDSKEQMKKLLREHEEIYSHMDREEAELLSACTGTKIVMRKEEEAVDMCKAWEDMAEECRELGINIGKEEGLSLGRQEGIEMGMIQSVTKLMDSLKCSLEEACKLLGVKMEEYKRAEVMNQ